MKKNIGSNLYYIYIDTKIQGAIEQLLNYFQSNIFNAHACIAIYAKYYKENYKVISELFEKYSIRYKFIKKYSDISFNNGKVVFYLFNAQSNCRMVAFRNVSHVFITHGESNKKSSVKPIVRIYDHVVTSGQVGIDRYLKAGIFNKFDVENNRVIRLGNTFVGQNNYTYDVNSRTLLYAPTWEGGVPDENFSSIVENIDKLLVKTVQEQSIKKLVIQTHPNLGHRDDNYRTVLDKFLTKLIKQGVKTFFVKDTISVSDKLRALYAGFKYVLPSKKISISHAIVDISAMEVQLLVKRVPTTVLAKRSTYKELIIPNRMSLYYSNTIVNLDDDSKSVGFFNPEIILPYIESYQEDHLKNLSFKKRVEWLCDYVHKDKILKTRIRESI